MVIKVDSERTGMSEDRRYVDITLSALSGFGVPRYAFGPPLAAGYARVPVSASFISMAALRACISDRDLEDAEAARQNFLSKRRDDRHARREIYRVLRDAVSRRANIEGIAFDADVFADMFRGAIRTQTGDAGNLEFAAAQAAKTAVVQSDKRLFVLADTGAGPEIIAETREGAPSDEARRQWYFDLGVELIFGLLALAGAVPKAGADVPKLWRDLMLRDKIKKAFGLLMAGGFDLADIVNFVKTLFEEDDIVDKLLTVLDCGFWAIIWALAKWGAKLTPGVGQALLAGAVALFAGKLCIKLIEGPKEIS
jgi:hypothetical protein